MGELTKKDIAEVIDKPGRYYDRDGLALYVRAPGQASWVCRVQHNLSRKDYGLGSAKKISLTVARDRARKVREALAEGRDPRMEWEKAPALMRTFKEAAVDYLDKASKAGDDRNKQYLSQLTAHAFPHLGRLQVQSLDADVIAKALLPIWSSKGETARQVLSLIVRVLSFTRPDGGQFEDTLAKAIAARLPERKRAGRFDALPYHELPALMARLEAKGGMAALALRFTILTACRSGEARGALWDEIDFDRAIWSIPQERTKTRQPHFVPLSAQALAVLRQAEKYRHGDHVFPSTKGGALSDMALTKCLRDLKLTCTAHGMRSAFRDYCAERGFKDDWAEAALAHTVAGRKGDTVAAYLRTTFFNDRRDKLMPAWGLFAVGKEPTAKVVQHPAIKGAK